MEDLTTLSSDKHSPEHFQINMRQSDYFMMMQKLKNDALWCKSAKNLAICFIYEARINLWCDLTTLHYTYIISISKLIHNNTTLLSPQRPYQRLETDWMKSSSVSVATRRPPLDIHRAGARVSLETRSSHINYARTGEWRRGRVIQFWRKQSICRQLSQWWRDHV